MTLLPTSGMSDRAPIVRPSSAEAGALMVSVFNSFVFDYCTRNAISGTDLSFFIIEQLPVPTPAQFMQQIDSEVTYKEFIIPRVLELTYTSSALQPFAHEVGYRGPPFLWCDERRFLIKCELDAAMFHLYGLDMEDLTHIMDAFPIVKRKDCEQYGEYRTKHMIQEIFTLIGEAIASRRPYRTVLSPRPGTMIRR